MTISFTIPDNFEILESYTLGWNLHRIALIFFCVSFNLNVNVMSNEGMNGIVYANLKREISRLFFLHGKRITKFEHRIKIGPMSWNKTSRLVSDTSTQNKTQFFKC